MSSEIIPHATSQCRPTHRAAFFANDDADRFFRLLIVVHGISEIFVVDFINRPSVRQSVDMSIFCSSVRSSVRRYVNISLVHPFVSPSICQYFARPFVRPPVVMSAFGPRVVLFFPTTRVRVIEYNNYCWIILLRTQISNVNGNLLKLILLR